MAAAAYRRALTQAPRNPWYHHNLGHLLDVALGQPEEAVGHLGMAEKHADPPEDEITASLAHCLFRVGRQEEAERMAAKALEMAPENAEHQALLDWIGAGSSTHPAPPRRPVQIHGVLAVGDLLEEHMRRAGFGPRGIARARALWSDYLDERQPRVKKPEVCAAAVHCAMVLVDEVDGITQASVARRYGATPGSVRNRFGDIRSTLALRPGDPRYRG
jgi:tetratricopeptide (TPR) repeat protein